MDEAERTAFLANLAKTRDIFQQAAAGLSESQARFKPAPESWSIEEIVEHVAVAEHGMYRLITELNERSDDPRETESAASLEQASDRKRLPRTAPSRACPKGRFGSLHASMKQFLENRARTIDFVRNCQDDLRFRLIQHPLGLLNGKDCFTVLINHPARHVEQIEELKASPGFPR
jgi:hypothetical protein